MRKRGGIKVRVRVRVGVKVRVRVRTSGQDKTFKKRIFSSGTPASLRTLIRVRVSVSVSVSVSVRHL